MLENDVALVTGASRGIGRAIALALAGAGARVVGTSTSAEGAAAFGELLASKGLQGRGAVLDVSSSGFHRAPARRARRRRRACPPSW